MREPLTLTQILMVLDDLRSIADLRRYFQEAGDEAYAGGQFERLGGGGSRPDIASIVTAEDLIAVELLSVQLPPHRLLDLLQGHLGERLAAELARIPIAVELGDMDAVPLIAAGGPADIAWRMLRDTDGIGWVIAGKLLARKRPKLVPVYDSVVACALRTGTGFWEWLHGRLREDNGALTQCLRVLHRQANLPAEVSLVRVLDVVFWMRHHHEHQGSSCPGLELS